MDIFPAFVREAIRINKELRLSNPNAARGLSQFQYVKDFCSVHINLGRRIGKTKFIIDSVKDGDVIISPLSFVNPSLRELKEDNPNLRIYSMSHLSRSFDIFDGENMSFPEYVYIDDASQVSDKRIIFELFADPTGQTEQTFVFLG